LSDSRDHPERRAARGRISVTANRASRYGAISDNLQDWIRAVANSPGNRDLIIQTDDGNIYAISADKLGKPIGGHSTGMDKLTTALAAHAGKAIGLRVAVMGYSLPSQVGENQVVTDIEKDLGSKQ
jgi:hypothetical protein